VSFAAITLCVASQRVFVVVSIYFFIGSVRKLLESPSYVKICCTMITFSFTGREEHKRNELLICY
jgi:hypothetical protein